MTIRKGEEWGTRIIAPEQLVMLSDDAQLAQLDPDSIGVLLGGDIHHTLGAPSPVLPGAECTQLNIDAIQVTVTTYLLEEFTVLASSRVEIGYFRPRIFKRQRYKCITNGGVIEGRNLAPRAHPNDGVLDCVEISAEMTFRDRLTAMRKAVSGTHIPHPQIQVSRSETFADLGGSNRPDLLIDGRIVPDWLTFSITVLPDYWKIVV